VANIFIVTDKGVITPRIEDGILPGITRKKIIELCRENNIPIFEEKICESDLMNAKEVFLTNRLVEIQPVIKINHQLINEGKLGKITNMLQKIYKNHIMNSVYLEKERINRCESYLAGKL
jgi:branched-subunit amino acid aminotransferase/4-amino-4-deoxychorismate lyase